ncbi:MAG: hypothetical protein DRQ37_00220 [Gammaproteobacteria bacterium]|nr:MAG: hypothetical protein DRQ37_00220 [Gammaproteobacteria bacterium]
MFDKNRDKPVKLDIENRVITFNSLTDFEFSLASRTEVPAHKIADLIPLSTEELRQEATNIRRVEKEFVSVLSKSLEEPGSIGRLMRELELQYFSQDHQWRSIIGALNRQDEQCDEFKKIALVKYMQYLNSRQDVLKSIYSSKDGDQSATPIEAAADAEPEANAALKETVIFDDVTRLDAGAPKGDEKVRLPKGETVTVSLPEGEEMDRSLSRHPFKLLSGRHFYLIDEAGADYLLRPGKNAVGRELDNEVVINAGYRDVSRTHLLIEPVGTDAALLTDLSSHGCFVPAQHLVHATEEN